MRSYVAILAIFCLLVGAAGAAGECGVCSFSTASNGNDCPACFFASDPNEVKCPACFFGDPASLNGCSACEFSVNLEGEGNATYQVSGGQIRITIVYRSPQAAPVVPEGFSRGYRGYDPADITSISRGQYTFDEPAVLPWRQGTPQGSERFAGILSASSRVSRFMH